MKRQVFYSFCNDDTMRTQQIRQIGAIDGSLPVSVNEWELVKRGGNSAIRKWIDNNMRYRSCIIVLVGEKTASLPWVQYEIKHAWETKKGLLGICIHNIKCPNAVRHGYSSICKKGENPFMNIMVNDTWRRNRLSNIVKCYNPGQINAYGVIQNNINYWIEEAIHIRNRYI